MLIINVVLLALALVMKLIGFAALSRGDYYPESQIAGMFGIALAVAATVVAVFWVNLLMVLVSLAVIGFTAGLYALEKRYAVRLDRADRGLPL